MRPDLHPPRIELRPLLVESQITSQPDPSQRILVLRRRMHHPWIMEDDIPGLVIAHQPPPHVLSVNCLELDRIMAHETVFRHVLVECVNTLLFG